MTNATVSCPATSIISLDPLRNDSNIVALNTFLQVVKTSIGHCGKLKIIQNIAGGHTTVTSSSERLFHNLSLKNTFLKFMVSPVKTHLKVFGDGGLFSSLLMLKLINNSLSLPHPLPLTGKLYEYFGRFFVQCLNCDTNSCVINLDLSQLSHLKSVAETILQSKPGCILSESSRNHLCLLLLKAFLNILPTATNSFSFNLSYITLEGLSAKQSKLYEGLLIKNCELSQKVINYLKSKSSLKTVLFTTSLSGDMEFPVKTIEVNNSSSFWDTVLNFLADVISKLITLNIDIVACQKVVHPVLKKQLEDANILVLERLGCETAKYFELISGSPGISSLTSSTVCGSVTSINEEVVGKNNFVLLCNKDKPFWTMLICSHNEESLNETKVVCKQAVSALFRLLHKPKVCFGAGCSDVFTSNLVGKKVKEHLNEIKDEIGCTASQILEILHVFQKSIIEVAFALHQGSSLDFVTENAYGHLWKIHNENFPIGDTKCMCGHLYAKDVDVSAWSFFSKSFSDSFIVLDKPLSKINSRTKTIILDELSCKVNAYVVAFETASLILRVTLCISSSV